MELFDYLMAKKGHNTYRDLFSYLLGKNAGGSGTYTTFSGTSLNISNTLQAKIKNIALEGNTSQETTTGKNLCDISQGFKNGYLATSDGHFVSENVSFVLNQHIEVSGGSTYTYSTNQQINNMSLYSFNANNEFIKREKIVYSKNVCTVTVNNDAKYICLGGNYDNSSVITQDILNGLDIQLELGETATDYEPYTGGIASPNPNYPQPIRVVTGEQNVTIQSKNLFNKSNYSNNRIVSRTTGELAQNNSYGTTDYIKVKANQTYYQSNVNAYYSVLYDENKEYYGIIGTAKFTPAIDGYIRTSFSKVDLDLVQIEIGEVATTYVPYQSQTYPLLLGNIELARTNNHKDYIFKNEVGSPYYNANLELNEWYLHKEMVKVTLTENSYWYYRDVTISGTSRKVFFSRYDNLKSYNSMRNMMCNYFKVKSTEGTSPTADNQFYNNYERTNNLEFTKFDITTVAEWKEWVATHNIVLIGKMVNPTNTKITDTTLISQLENINNNARSYKDTTIIECSSASTDNETIGFSGEIKVTSVGLGNSLNTSLLSSNLQEETNIDDIQEETNLDEIEDIEQNDEPIENEEIEEPIEEYQEL